MTPEEHQRLNDSDVAQYHQAKQEADRAHRARVLVTRALAGVHLVNTDLVDGRCVKLPLLYSERREIARILDNAGLLRTEED